jgi:hypothetical protein
MWFVFVHQCLIFLSVVHHQMGGKQSQPEEPKLSVGTTEVQIWKKLKPLNFFCGNTSAIIAEYATNLPIFNRFLNSKCVLYLSQQLTFLDETVSNQNNPALVYSGDCRTVIIGQDKSESHILTSECFFANQILDFNISAQSTSSFIMCITIIEDSSSFQEVVHLIDLEKMPREFRIRCIFEPSLLTVKYMSPLLLLSTQSERRINARQGAQRFHCFFHFEFGQGTEFCTLSLK